MDTQEQGLTVKAPRKKLRRHSIRARREIVEETLIAGVSVSRVATRHDVNANQVFYWRKLHRKGRLGDTRQLLAVEVTQRSVHARDRRGFRSILGKHRDKAIKLAKGSLQVFRSIDTSALRVLLECLAE